MSKNLSAVARTEFDTEVKQAYQMGSKLGNTVTVRSNVVGDTYKFRGMGKGMANQKASQADVTPMDVTHSTPTATLANWNAPEYTDIFDNAEVNFDEQVELAQAIAMAIGRRKDQIIIDAAEAASSPGTVAAGAADQTVAKANEAAMNLNAAGVGSGDRTYLVSAEGLEAMLNQEKATSADYMQVKALVNGDLNSAFSFNWIVIEDRDEGGLTLSGNDRTSLAYHKSAIGYAEGIGPRTEVNYVAEKTSWLANGILKAGAISRDDSGIVHITNDESA